VSNIAVSSGDDGLLLVDTGFSARAVERLQRALHDLGARQVRYIINTHLHPDHIAGNSIGNDGATIIDQSNLTQRVSEGVLSLGGEPIPGRTGKAFDTYYALGFNGEEVRLIPYPGIHTDNDLIVHFTRSGVVHMGDLLISQSFPSITGKVDEYLELLERTLDVFPETTTFVCGHGREMTSTDVKEYRDMLAAAAAIVRRHMQEGKERREVREAGALAEFAKWGTFIPILNADYWIDAVYNSAAEGS
jgi:glyoxylase-like metal-dependent hydrolase (beta-lactamase superfamily II)